MNKGTKHHAFTIHHDMSFPAAGLLGRAMARRTIAFRVLNRSTAVILAEALAARPAASHATMSNA